MIKLQIKDQPQIYVSLTTNSVTLGRDPGNHLQVEHESVSDFHAEITREGEDLYILDLLSSSGTFVNDLRISGQLKLTAWDTVRLGSVELELNDPTRPRPNPWMLQAQDADTPPVPLSGYTLIGRDSDCDFTIDSPRLSRRHAAITVRGDHLEVVDLDSANGTFVNGSRIHQGQAGPGDHIAFENRVFTVLRPGRPPSVSDATIINPVAEGSQTEILTPRTATASLRETSGLISPDPIPLRGERMRIGRNGDNELVVPDGSISRLHALLLYRDGHWLIEDNNSSNGVFVNGTRINQQQLEHQDSITLGRAKFEFHR